MKKNQILSRLKEHRAALEAEGVEHVSIFGSVARGQERADSDLDLLVAFSPAVFEDGFAYFSRIDDLRHLLQRITGVERIDIVAEPVSKESLRYAIARDRALAF